MKTYVNKDYETSCGVPGTLTYTYYEGDNGDYVKHGKYTVNASETEPKYWSSSRKEYVTKSTKYTASANFKDGWLNGTLTVTVTTTRASASKTEKYVSSLTANFSDGMPHGAWKMTRTENAKTTFSISANFSNGVLVGSFALDDELKGQFDNNGFYQGKWIGKDGKKDNEYNFINGVYVSHYEREDGKVIWSEPRETEEKELYKKYAEGLMTEDELMEYGYSVEVSSARLLGSNGPEFMNTILYQGNDCFGLKAIGGDKTSDKNRPEKCVMGKYYRITKEQDIKVFKAGEFESYAKSIEYSLKNELFEENKQISSAEALWVGYRVKQEQKDRLTNIYNQYIQEWRPAKLQRIEEQKRLAEEARQKEEVKAFKDFTSIALDKIVSVSSNKADMKIFGADIVIATDYDKDRTWDALFSSYSPLRDKLGKQLKDFCPVSSYTIDSVDVANRTVYCTLEKYNKKDGSQYWQTQVVFNSKNIDLDKSFIFSKAIKIKGDWDIIRELQKSIETNKNTIGIQAGSECPDVTKTYNAFHKSSNLKVSDDLQETIARLKKVIDVQQSYLKFIGLRKQVIAKQNQIENKCGKEYSDVAKSYESFLKDYDLSMSSDSTESYQRLNSLMALQDSCLTFLDLRKNITANNNELLGKKACKNILKVYASYMKTADLSWTSDPNCCDKLRKVIITQKKLLAAANSSNAAQLDQKIKKLKDKSMDNVVKELQ